MNRRAGGHRGSLVLQQGPKLRHLIVALHSRLFLHQPDLGIRIQQQ